MPDFGIRTSIEVEGRTRCRHRLWRDLTYNDWGLPYYVLECLECGRRISAPVRTPEISEALSQT